MVSARTLVRPNDSTTSMRWLLAGVFLVMMVLAMPSCRTTSGFGDDVKHLGSGIEKSADKHTD